MVANIVSQYLYIGLLVMLDSHLYSHELHIHVLLSVYRLYSHEISKVFPITPLPHSITILVLTISSIHWKYLCIARLIPTFRT